MDLRPVKGEKISELILQQIRDAILTGAVKPGDRLPSERELVNRFQVSRISVREALKSLETSGLLTIKPGSGVFVAEVNSKPISRSLSSMLRIQGASFNELTEARIVFEPSIARLASEKIAPEEFLKIEQNIEKALANINSNSPAFAPNIEFHSIVAEATHNPVITLTMKTFFDVLKEMAPEAILERIGTTSLRAVIHHKKILKGLQEKNPEKVYQMMREHILEIQKDWSCSI